MHHPKNINKRLTTTNPDQVIRILHKGNQRFLANSRLNRDHHMGIDATKDGQQPIAAILSCMDSRVAAELIFDQGIGDLFNIRIAGNVITPEVLGSLEYAVAISRIPVILILGHTGCGAIGGACDQVNLGNLTGLLEKIRPAILAEKHTLHNRHSQNRDFVLNVTLLHLENVRKEMLASSEVIATAVTENRLLVATAIYDVASGQANFLGTTNKAKSVKQRHE